MTELSGKHIVTLCEAYGMPISHAAAFFTPSSRTLYRYIDGDQVLTPLLEEELVTALAWISHVQSLINNGEQAPKRTYTSAKTPETLIRHLEARRKIEDLEHMCQAVSFDAVE